MAFQFLPLAVAALCIASASADSIKRSPESFGISSSAMSEWIGELEKVERPSDFIVMRHGKCVCSGSWKGIVRGVGATNEGVSGGRSPIGGLTRLLIHVAAGMAVDKDMLKDDAVLDALVARMTKDDADGAAAADELSALVERSAKESTEAFLVDNFMNWLEGGILVDWAAEPQVQDKRLMKGSDGVSLWIADLGRIGNCLLHGGKSGSRQLVSAEWLRRHPIRVAAFGGNVMVLSPEKDALVAVLSSAKDPKPILDAVERLLATFKDDPLPESPADAARLSKTCASLSLPEQKIGAEKPSQTKPPPSLGKRLSVLDILPHGNYRRNSEGDMIRLRDGRLMLVWSRMMGSTSDAAKSHICRRYSSDMGKTWTEDEIVFSTPAGAQNVMSVSLLRLASGKIALVFLRKNSEQDCRSVFYRSSDEGRTWDGPVEMIQDGIKGYYVGNNARLVQIESGRLVYPTARNNTIYHFLSDDEGLTWRPGKATITGKKQNGRPIRLEEPGTIELKDGRLMTYIRTNADWQYVSYSPDGGETWSPPCPGNLRSPRSPALLKRLSDGRIAAIWNDHSRHPENRFKFPYHNGVRAPLTLAFSSDEGKTWNRWDDLETEGWSCYPFALEADGRLFVGYSMGGGLDALRIVEIGASAPSASGWRWIDGADLPIEGRAFDDVESYYDRLPASARPPDVSPGVQALKHHTSGMKFRFKTTSPTLAFRWTPYYDAGDPQRLPGCLYNGALGMAHMTAIGVSGIDVYVQGADGAWKYLTSGFIYASADRNAPSIGQITRFSLAPGTPVMVHLPLYNGLRKFEVEVAAGATVEPLPPRRSGIEKPVVFYGTSVTQGGCASRPGMSFANIVGRMLDVPTVNLGFSGHGRMELAMADYLSRIDASCYVLDCLWNMRMSDPSTRQAQAAGGYTCVDLNYEPFIRRLRAARPDVPIVMAEQCEVCGGKANEKEKFIRALYERLVSEGWKKLVYLPKTAMYSGDGEGTVDGRHPNDHGMEELAAAFGGAVSNGIWSGSHARAAESKRPVPDRNLLERMRSGVDVIGIVHFTVNTFTDREWGYGSESPDDFNPTDFDADQIVKACRDGGIKGLVVVAKHHDGFCLWPTKTTGHNITKTSFWRGTGNGDRGTGRDYVKEMEQACRRHGLKFGVYCSPWDRNNAAYATPEYVKTFHAQVEELNDGRYGEIFEMWFDGANGGDGYYGGAWERRSIAGSPDYYKMGKLRTRVLELQPKVCFFGSGNGFTWPGNESGIVPPESGGTRDNGTFRIYEADFPLRPGWFYHKSQDGYSRSGEFLMNIYLRTVGNGATMDIGISPDRRGRLTDEDVGCLRRFAEVRKAFFSRPVVDASSPFNVVVMTEDIEHGERVDEWRVLLDGRELAKGGKIGTKRIRVLDTPVSGKDFRLEIVKGDATADEIKVELFLADEELVRKVMASEEPKRPPAPFELQGVLTSRKNGELVYMMKHPRTVSSLVLSPDAESLDGTPVAFRLAYSVDGDKWTEDATEYRLDNVAANPVPQKVVLTKAVKVKYLRIKPVRTLKEGAAVRLKSLEFVDGSAEAFPRVWTSANGIGKTVDFETVVKDCRAHGVDVIECHARDEKTCAESLAICRRHGMKLQIGIGDASKCDWNAKKTGRYELAVMSGGCYKGLAIDRNLFSFTAAKHEIIVEPPVYSKGQAYANHPHYYMLGDGHYFGGYVPTGKAEIVVPEKLFDGRQHLRIIPAKVEAAPFGAVPENDSAAKILDTDEIRNRRLVKLSFDLSDCKWCLLDKVGIVVYWQMDDKNPEWKPDRTCYSVFSPITRERMRENVRNLLATWTRANGGKFPDDAVVGLRLGDEIFNATGWLDCPAASFPLWDYSASALAAFRAASPKGVEPPRTWGAPEVYGADACAQFLYLFHKACADYLRAGVEEAHRATPSIITFRNTTRGDAWSYGNDHDGTGQELIAAAIDAIHIDPYPVVKSGYANESIPFDMSYLSGLARRYRKSLLPWMQAHEFPSCGLIHPTPEDIARMWRQMKPFAPDAVMWLGYNPSGKGMMTFPLANASSWEKAKEVHIDLKGMPRPTRSRPSLAIVRPYSARAVVCETSKGFVHPSDAVLREFAKAWSCDLGQQYDVFEVPPFETEEAKTKRNTELKQYAYVVSSVDWPGAMNVARDCADKVLTWKDLQRMRGEFRSLGDSWLKKRSEGGSPVAKVRGDVSKSVQYERLHPRFAKAFEFMRRPDLAELPCGRYEIDGSNCWAMVSEVSLKPFADENQYEVHREFIDIHAPITGCETIGVVTPDPKVFDGFNVEKDYVLFTAKGEPWTLKPGEFAVFFPEKGAHAPGLSFDGPRKIRKLVVKVRARL